VAQPLVQRDLQQEECLKMIPGLNKFLTKLAAARDDEADAAKTFAKSSLGGWVGHLGGAAAGAVALGSTPGRKLLAATRRSRVGYGIRKGIWAVKGSDPAKKVGEFFGNKAGAAVTGGLLGGFVGEEAANYAATRHGVLQAKQNARTKQASEMANKFLEKIAKMSEQELNRKAWHTSLAGVGLGTLASPIPLGAIAGNMYGRHAVMKGIPHIKGKDQPVSRAVGSWAWGAGGGIAGAAVGGAAGAGVGHVAGHVLDRVNKKMHGRGAANKLALAGGTVGAVAGLFKGDQLGTRHHLRKMVNGNDD
jgi:hypothetical protein